jgi:hypothetical protein
MIIETLQDDEDVLTDRAMTDDPTRNPSLGMEAGEKRVDTLGGTNDTFNVDIMIMINVLTPIGATMSAMWRHMGTGELHLEEGGHAAVVGRNLHVNRLDPIAFFLKKNFMHHTFGPTA